MNPSILMMDDFLIFLYNLITMNSSQEISIQPMSGNCGAQIDGVQINADLSNAAFDAIHQAFLDYGVVFFRAQKISLEDQIAFGRRFGTLDEHPIVEGMGEYPEIIKVVKPAGASAQFGTGWHTDNSFFAAPSMATILFGKKVPPYGGDTLFANQYLAYKTLSDGMKKMLDGLTAIHSARYAYTSPQTKEKYEGRAPMKYKWSKQVMEEVEHPVVRIHPETGKKALYVNQMFTTRFKDMTEKESRPLLDYLFGHAARPDLCCCFTWQQDSVAIWDNRCVQHYATDDYQEFERIMFRATIKGDRPSPKKKGAEQ